MAPIRDIALSSFNSCNQRENPPSDSKHGTTARHRLAETLKSPLHSRNKRAGPLTSPGERRHEGSPKRLRAGSVGEDVIVIDDPRASPSPSSKSPPKLHKGEQNRTMMVERGASEKASKGADDGTLDPRKVLRLFRVDQKKLA